MPGPKFEISSDPLLTGNSGSQGVWPILKTILQPLSSLKLTVVLLAMSAFIVLAGTLAQVDMEQPCQQCRFDER